MATYDDLLKQAPEYTPGAPAAIDGASAPMGAPGSIAPAHVDARCAAFVDRTVEQLGRQADALIPVLQSIQKRFGYLPREALEHLCEVSEITPRDIAGVSTFYSRFRHEPAGTHIISVCHGTACHVKGAPLISSALRRYLKLEEGQTTSADGVFTLDSVDCLGCCTLAPVVQIDGITYGHVTPDGVGQVLTDFLELARGGGVEARPGSGERAPGGLAEVRIGVGSCCIAGGSMDVLTQMQEALRRINAPAVVKPVGCVGMCHQTPLVEIEKPGEEIAVYARVQPGDAEAIAYRHFRPRGLAGRARVAVSRAVDRLLTDENWPPPDRYALDVRDAPVCAFLGPQRHLATELYGAANPLDLDDYRAHGGFEALKRCVTKLSPEGVIDTVERSGLRGRGGAGFPSGEKWRRVRAAAGERKFVICNGDEGDPGAFMDRMILESYPFRVLEGLAIAAWAVGAHEAVLYIRAEYALAVQRIWEAIQLCEDQALLGDNVFGTGVRILVGIMEGAGAFVCGEETGLMASLEGRRGNPRLRPPYPSEQGLWDCPTLVNNVETLALVPTIVRNGARTLSELGTGRSRGTKVFSLTGKVRRGGLIEVPMGITIRQIVEDIGGGVADGRSFKAVQIGGPSGGCIPAELADTPVDYEALNEIGAIMGSGGLVVLDDSDCMLDVARYFLQFTQRDSCGKCVPCRIGTRRMLDILDRLCSGHGRISDLEQLEQLAAMVRSSSLCGLGQTAPNPVLTTLRYFRDEYLAHIDGRCPAGRCKELITYSITDECIGCTRCAQQCPAHAIAFTPYEKHAIDASKCIRCDTCRQLCPTNAVRID